MKIKQVILYGLMSNSIDKDYVVATTFIISDNVCNVASYIPSLTDQPLHKTSYVHPHQLQGYITQGCERGRKRLQVADELAKS